MKKLAILPLAAFALAACGGPYTLTEAERQTAELGGRQWAQAAGYEFVQCSGQDSNGDNYTTCTTKKPSGEMQEIVCSFKASATGCKTKTAALEIRRAAA